MVTIHADKANTLLLGHVGENDCTEVVFSEIIAAWLSEYPNATIGIINRPARQDDGYPVANIQQTGSVVTWTIKAADLSEEGRGQCQLVAVQDEVIKKSAYWDTRVMPSLKGSDTPPDPKSEWWLELVRLKSEAEAAAEAAEEAASHYPKTEGGIWQVWDVETGAYISTGIYAQGPKGVTFIPSVSENGTISWANDGGLPNPESRNIKGPAGAVYTPSVSDQGVISWTNDGGLPNPPDKNIKGTPGDDGISPVITVETITGGHRITIVDADHPQGQTIDVMDGVNGQDGRGIVSIEKTDTSGLVDTYTITYTSGNPTTFTVVNGTPGADGQDGTDGTDGVNAYVWIRYASAQPTQDSDMSTTPGPWMGVYSGSSATAPTHYNDYEWNNVKGPQGDDYVLTAADKAEIAGIAAGELQPAITELDEKKADKNGDYPGLTAGNADQLLATVGATDKVPYLFRTSGGGVTVGDREVDKIVGGTVAWNQLIDQTSPIVLVKSTARTVSITGKAGDRIVAGHKYLYSITLSDSENLSNHAFFHLFVRDSGENTSICQIYSKDNGVHAAIFTSTKNAVSTGSTAATDGNWWLYFGVNNSEADNATITVSNVQLIDLTQMFGATIADYINTLETATPGAGVAWFRALFPKPYYAYDAGSLQSVQVSAHVMRDASEAVIGNYPLDSSLILRGIPKLDSNNRLYYDGDTYESDGTVTRKYASINLGTLEWQIGVTSETGKYRKKSTSLVGTAKGAASASSIPNLICSKYSAASPNATYLTVDKSITIDSNGNVYVYDSTYNGNDDYNTFTTAMNGVYLIYELDEPATETAAPYQNPQIVDAAGTEQYIDAGERDVEIPVGHETFYPENLRKKIEEAPDSPTADGDYLMRRENGENSYVPYNGASSAFYGLAGAAGDTTQSASGNPVGTYTDVAKGKIQEMVGTSAQNGIVQNGDTADQYIESGKFVVWKGSLYRASANIAQGETLSSSNLTVVPDGGFNVLLPMVMDVNFTLIDEVTTTEDKTEITFDFANPLKTILVTAVIKSNGLSGQLIRMTMQDTPHVNTSTWYTLGYGEGNNMTQYDAYATFIGSIIHGRWFALGSVSLYGTSNMGKNITFRPDMLGWHTPLNISRAKLYGLTMPSGTNVKIYGILA